VVTDRTRQGTAGRSNWTDLVTSPASTPPSPRYFLAGSCSLYQLAASSWRVDEDPSLPFFTLLTGSMSSAGRFADRTFGTSSADLAGPMHGVSSMVFRSCHPRSRFREYLRFKSNGTVIVPRIAFTSFASRLHGISGMPSRVKLSGLPNSSRKERGQYDGEKGATCMMATKTRPVRQWGAL
jgi:hypothetical protein